MAPKFRNGKPLFKGGKPAFCCCGVTGECCFYAAAHFGSLFGVTDLPATLNGVIDGSNVTLTKTGSTPVVYTGSWSGNDVLVETGWRLKIVGLGGPGSDAVYDSNCLVTSAVIPGDENPPGSPGDVYIEDEFPEVLLITFTNLNYEEFPLVGMVERVNTCDWEGYVGSIGMSLRLRWNSESCKFTITFDGGNDSDKVDPQDTPEGSYADSGDFTGISVAEPP